MWIINQKEINKFNNNQYFKKSIEQSIKKANSKKITPETLKLYTWEDDNGINFYLLYNIDNIIGIENFGSNCTMGFIEWDGENKNE